MLAAAHDFIELIDPWRKVEPPHGQLPDRGSALERAYRLRLRFQHYDRYAVAPTANVSVSA